MGNNKLYENQGQQTGIYENLDEAGAFDLYLEGYPVATIRPAEDAPVSMPGLAALRTAKVILTSAQIKAMAAANPELAPAPDASSFNELVSAFFVLRAGTNVLTMAAQSFEILYGEAGASAITPLSADGFINADAGTSAGLLVHGVDLNVAADMDDLLGLPLVLNNDGAEFAGNAAGDATMEIFVTYRVHTLE